MPSKTPIKSKDDILKFFEDASVPNKELLIGIEVERSAVFEHDLSPVHYAGKSGYLAILQKLVKEVGWKVSNEDDNGNILAIKRGGTEIHMEYDGRLELVSKPRKGLPSLCSEYQMHIRELDGISKEFGIRWVSMGWQPFSKTKDISFAFPQKMEAVSKHQGELYPDWEKNLFEAWGKKSNGVHVNFGYTSERDAIEKFQTLFKLSPILMAMFANSPINAGKFSGLLVNRPRATFELCPTKTKIQEIFFEKDFSFDKWIDFLIDLPMRRIERNSKHILIPLSFRDFIKNGFKRHHAQMRDFHLHIKSVWCEIRLKNYLEYRGFDTVPPHLLNSIPAIIRGITLNSDIMKQCQNLVKDWTFADHLQMRERVCKDALQAETPDGKKVLVLAKELLEITSTGLKDHHIKTHSRVDDSRFLWPIKEYIFVREQSPAEYVMEMWKKEWHNNPQKLLEWSES